MFETTCSASLALALLIALATAINESNFSALPLENLETITVKIDDLLNKLMFIMFSVFLFLTAVKTYGHRLQATVKNFQTRFQKYTINHETK